MWVSAYALGRWAQLDSPGAEAGSQEGPSTKAVVWAPRGPQPVPVQSLKLVCYREKVIIQHRPAGPAGLTGCEGIEHLRAPRGRAGGTHAPLLPQVPSPATTRSCCRSTPSGSWGTRATTSARSVPQPPSSVRPHGARGDRGACRGSQAPPHRALCRISMAFCCICGGLC